MSDLGESPQAMQQTALAPEEGEGGTRSRPTAEPLVYDWVTRFFHWVFAGLFVSAFALGRLAGDDSPNFPFHMLLGMTLGVVLLLRVLWGLLGSRYARFRSWVLKPSELIGYFAGLLVGVRAAAGGSPSAAGRRWLGHNPASSWSALLMMALAGGLVLSGVLMVRGLGSEWVEEAHELFGNGLALVALLHVAGVVLHTLRHREAIGLSMVIGTKKPVPGAEGISHSNLLAGLGFLGVALGVGTYLFRSYDQRSGTLAVGATTLQLGENAEAEDEENEHPGEGHEAQEHEGEGYED